MSTKTSVLGVEPGTLVTKRNAKKAKRLKDMKEARAKKNAIENRMGAKELADIESEPIFEFEEGNAWRYQ